MNELSGVEPIRSFSKSFVGAEGSDRAEMEPPTEFHEEINSRLDKLKEDFSHIAYLSAVIRTVEAAMKNGDYGIWTLGWYDFWPDDDDPCMHWPFIAEWLHEAGVQDLVSPKTLLTATSMRDTRNERKIAAYYCADKLWQVGNQELPRFCYGLTKLRGILLAQADQATQWQGKVTATIMTLVITFGQYMMKPMQDLAQDAWEQYQYSNTTA
mmetsp:Transcript_54930/g.96338  ORF Transcript_54930/g.96338 Transcript_54930/m.96338 type:complete len:211 (-) Transcript_54930:54-686(-)